MKNLLLIPILFNNLGGVVVEERGNDIITTAHLGIQEGTDASQTYTYTEEGQTNDPPYMEHANFKITQKYNAQAQQNNYANFVIYNYCNLDYNYYAIGGTDLYYNTYVIIQYTPYKNIDSSQVDITLNFNENMYIDYDANNGFYMNIDYIIARTNKDLGNLLNTSNWTNFEVAKRESTLTNTQTYWQQSYTNNSQKNTISQNNEEINPTLNNSQNLYRVTLNNVDLTSNATTYIIMQVELTYEIDETSDYRKDFIYPNNQTELLHTNYVEITSSLRNEQYVNEIVDIPGLMFTILTLPFSFISQAFDLTIFPGTQYQINFSNIMLGFIAIAMLMWVLKLILGRADLGQWLGDQRRNLREERSRDKEHKRQMQRIEEQNRNRHEELQQRERLAHERAQKHEGKR